MSTWPLKKLGDIFEIARGGSPRPIAKYITDDADGVNWIMIGDASERTKYIDHTKKRIKKSGVGKSRMVYPGDFLLSNSMSFGRPYIMKTTGCIHDGWLVLRDKEGQADSDYFYYLLGSRVVYQEFKRLAPGSTVKNLNIELVSSVEVALPPLEEQKRIAAVLDRADGIRVKHISAADIAQDLVQALIGRAFSGEL